MKDHDILKNIPKDGFIKLTRDKSPALKPDQKAALIRKGNELFNKGDISQAKKIFLTVGYTDGIIRLGSYYYKKNMPLEAFRMYCLAPDQQKKEAFIEKMAGVIKNWLTE
jgi:hypothetical protein